MIKHVPNILSLLRIAMVPMVVVLLYQQDYFTALLVFALAGITDGIDGFIAKRFDAQSELGAMLDPMADKLLLVSTYIMLALQGHLPFWLLVLVIFRDLVIVGGYGMLVLLGDELAVRPSWLSKWNTFLQIVLVIVVLLLLGAAVSMPLISNGLIYLVGATTIASGVAYVWQGVQMHYAGQA